jgi:hypothetical protein
VILEYKIFGFFRVLSMSLKIRQKEYVYNLKRVVKFVFRSVLSGPETFSNMSWFLFHHGSISDKFCRARNLSEFFKSQV